MKRFLFFFLLFLAFFFVLPSVIDEDMNYLFLGFSLLLVFISYSLNFLDRQYRIPIYSISSLLFIYFIPQALMQNLDQQLMDFLETSVLILLTLSVSIRFNISQRFNIKSKATKGVFSSYLVSLGLLALLFLSLYYFFNESYELKQSDYLILIAALLCPAPLFVLEMTRNSQQKQSESRFLFHIDSLRFLSFILIFSAILFAFHSKIEVNELLRVGIFSLSFFFLLQLFQNYHRLYLIWIIILFSFFLSEFQLLSSNLSIVLMSFLAGIFIRREKGLSNELTKRLSKIYPQVLFFFIFILSFKLIDSIHQFQDLSIYLFLPILIFHLLLASINRYVFKYHLNWLTIFSAMSIQSFFALFILDYFSSTLLLTLEIENLFQNVLVLNLSFSLLFYILFPFLNYKKDGESELIELKNDFETLEYENPKVESFLSHLESENRVYAGDLLEKISDHIEWHAAFFQNLMDHYSSVKEKLFKEIHELREAKDVDPAVKSIIKDRLRENRNLFSKKFQEDIQESKFENTLSDEYQQYLQKLIKEIQKAGVIRSLVNQDIFKKDAEDRFPRVLVKFLTRFLIGVKRFFNSNFILEHDINLRSVLLFSFYEHFSPFSQLVLKEYFKDFIQLNKKLSNFYRDLDQHFVEMLDFTNESDLSEEFNEKLNFAQMELAQEAEDELNLLLDEVKAAKNKVEDLLEKSFTSFLRHSTKDIAYYDTPLLRKSKQHLSKAFEKYEFTLKKNKQIQERFKEKQKAFLNLQSLENETRFIQNAVRKTINKYVELFNTDVSKSIVTIVDRLKAEIERLDLLVDTEEKSFLKQRKKLLYLFQTLVFKELDRVKENGDTLGFIDQILNEINKTVTRSPRIFQIATQKSIYNSDLNPDGKAILFNFPYQKTIKNLLEVEANRNLMGIRNQLLVGLENVSSIFESLKSEIHDFSAFELISDENRKKIKDLFSDILKRLGDVGSFVDSISDNIEKTIVKEIVRSLKLIKDKIELEEADGQDTQASKDKKNTFEWLQNNKLSRLASYLPKALLNLNIIRKESKKDALFSSKIRRSELFAEREQGIKKLPFMYRKIMTLDALELSDYLYDRDWEIRKVEELLYSWKKGNTTSLAIHADIGNGKSSFLNIVQKLVLQNEKLIRVKLNREINSEMDLLEKLTKRLAFGLEFKSLNDLQNYIVENDLRLIFMLESSQYLFRKRISGFDLLRSFMQFMQKSEANIFWIMSFSEFSWKFLKNSFSIEEYFLADIKLKAVSENRARQIIDLRNKTSGYEFIFQTEEKKSAFNVFRRKAKEERVIQAYFKSLYKFSKGNIFRLIYLWLSSLELSEENLIKVHPLRELSADFLNSFDDEKLLILLAFLEQGSLSKEDLSEQFHFSLTYSESILSELVNYHLLEFKDASYSISKVSAIDCIRAIEQKGLV